MNINKRAAVAGIPDAMVGVPTGHHLECVRRLPFGSAQGPEAAAGPGTGAPFGNGHKTGKPDVLMDNGLPYKIRHRPTLPPVTAIPSALAGLTALFGMGRGRHRRYRHLNIFLDLRSGIRVSGAFKVRNNPYVHI